MTADFPASEMRADAAGSGDEVYISTVNVPTGGKVHNECMITVGELPPERTAITMQVENAGEPGEPPSITADIVSPFPQEILPGGTLDVQLVYDIEIGSDDPVPPDFVLTTQTTVSPE